MPAPLALLLEGETPITHKITGFTIFRSDKATKESIGNVAGIARAWKALPAAEKEGWNAKAATLNHAALEAAGAAEEAAKDDEGLNEGQACQVVVRPKIMVPAVKDLEESLLGANAGSSPIAFRMRVTYYLRTIGTAECIDILCRSLTYTNPASASRPTPTEEFNDTHVHSPLLRHEVAFVLGQLRNAQACATLEEVLRDVNDDVMVRHECAEALGAIGDVRSIPLLEALASDATGNDLEEIQQTCEVARDFLNWKAVGGESSGEARPGVVCACMISEYNSHDPAPADPATDSLSIEEVGAILRDDLRPLFERYGAMFALRNRGGDGAANQLGLTLVQDTSSALLRHEVAYVLGQMQLPCAVPALAESLRRHNEHRMVRHESAEALGAIEFPDADGSTDAANSINTANHRDALLREFSSIEVEHDQAVRESCLVALDSSNYWSMFSGSGGSGGAEGGKSQSFAQQKAGGVATNLASGAGGTGDERMPSHAELAAAHFNTAL